MWTFGCLPWTHDANFRVAAFSNFVTKAIISDTISAFTNETQDFGCFIDIFMMYPQQYVFFL